MKLALVLFGSNQCFNWPLIVLPAGFQETLTFPYSSDKTDAPHAEAPPCNCPIILRFWLKSGEPEDPGSVTPRSQESTPQ